MIVVIDCGAGNFNSVINMYKKLGIEAKKASNYEDIIQASKIVLPGVGSFDPMMEKIYSKNLADVLNFKVMEEKVPILGICLGAQIMCNSSQEGQNRGFGWLEAEVVRFRFSNDSPEKIPHMRWNSINIKKENKLFNNIDRDSRFYFVHSYHFKLKNNENEICVTNYGYEFVSAFQKNNIFGVQFHPEKSHKFGLKLFQNFASI